MKFISLNPDIIKNVMKIRDWVNSAHNPPKLYIDKYIPYNGHYGSDISYNNKIENDIIKNNIFNTKYINLCNEELLTYILNYYSYLSSDYRLNENMIIRRIIYKHWYKFPIEISYVFIRKNNMYKYLYKYHNQIDNVIIAEPNTFSSKFHKCKYIQNFYKIKYIDDNDYDDIDLFRCYDNLDDNELNSCLNHFHAEPLETTPVFTVSRKYFI